MSKTAVSFAFNTPDRLAPETATRIREVAEPLGYRPHPVARMLTQRQTMTIGVLTPQALAVIFSQPVLRRVQRGRRAGGRGARLRPALHLAAARLAGRARSAGRRSTASSRSACRTAIPRSSRSAAPACRSCSSTRPPCRSTARSRSTTRAARGPPPSTSLGLGHRDVLVIGVEPPAPGEPRPGRRHRPPPARLSRGLRGRGRRAPRRARRRRPGQHRGRRRRPRPRLGGRPPPDRRAGDERRDGDRRDARRARPAPALSRATSASSASTTSTSPRTSTPRSRRSISRSVGRARRRSACS